MFLYILKLSGNEQTAEEITGETFCKAMSSLNSFRGDCEIRVWLCQIAKNCYYTYLRKSKFTVDIDDVAFFDESLYDETFEERMSQHDVAMRIQKVLVNMPQPYKDVFTWRVFSELSYKQIGQIFSKSENWACVTYHRARKMITERLEDSKNER